MAWRDADAFTQACRPMSGDCIALTMAGGRGYSYPVCVVRKFCGGTVCSFNDINRRHAVSVRVCIVEEI